jgi:hypothetical protein
MMKMMRLGRNMMSAAAAAMPCPATVLAPAAVVESVLR